MRGTPKKSKNVIVKSPSQLKAEKENAEKYRTKLRKRSPVKSFVNAYKEVDPFLKKLPTKKLKSKQKRLTISAEKPKKARNPRPHRLLQGKVDLFLDQLQSKEEMDVECNAEILAEIIKSFAVTFSLEISEIVEMISNQKGALNMEEIRMQLMNKGN